MAYRYGEDRYQVTMFPETLDSYVPEDDPARAYDAFVESLDMEKLKIKINSNKPGCREYNPKAMLKLLLYGYSYEIRSSRKLERAAHHNIIFIWLTSGLKPDYKTISRFRKNNIWTLKQVFKECAKLCLKLELIEGNTLFVDGTKMRANASINQTLTEKKCKEYLSKVDMRINKMFEECAQVDKEQKDQGSWIKLPKKLRKEHKRKILIEKTLKEIREEEKKSLNITDKDCVKIKGRQGLHAGYNAQIVTDEKNGLIVSNDVVSESNDIKQFSNQINKKQNWQNNKTFS